MTFEPTVAEAIDARLLLEASIAASLRAFEARFGVQIDRVDIRRERAFGTSACPVIDVAAQVTL